MTDDACSIGRRKAYLPTHPSLTAAPKTASGSGGRRSCGRWGGCGSREWRRSRPVVADVADGHGGFDGLHAGERERPPAAVAAFPIEGRFPAFAGGGGPAVGEPQLRAGVAPVVDELQVLGIRHEAPAEGEGGEI